MTLHAWRKVAGDARAVPGSYGLRRFRVYAIVREWTGATIGDGLSGDVVTELLEAGYPPKVRELTGEEIAVNGLSGRTFEVGPFTPEWESGGDTGGVKFTDIMPAAKGGSTERLYRIVGDEFGEEGQLFALSQWAKTANFRYTLQLTPIEGLE